MHAAGSTGKGSFAVAIYETASRTVGLRLHEGPEPARWFGHADCGR